MSIKRSATEQKKLFKEKTNLEFSEAYTKYYTRLLRYIYPNFIKDEQEAEDIISESFMKAYDKIETYDNEKSKFATWLYTVTRNEALGEIKKKKKKNTMSLDAEVDDTSTSFSEFIGDESINLDKKDRYISYLKAKAIRSQIPMLEEPYRSVIIMREVKGMQYKDISDKLGRNISTIKSQIRKGRQILHKKTKAEINNIERSVQ